MTRTSTWTYSNNTSSTSSSSSSSSSSWFTEADILKDDEHKLAEGAVRRLLYSHVQKYLVTLDDFAVWCLELREQIFIDYHQGLALQDKVVKFNKKMINDRHFVETEEELFKGANTVSTHRDSL